jgi:hypothetical protein
MSNDLSVDDEEGMDLPDLNAARLQAEKYATIWLEPRCWSTAS